MDTLIRDSEFNALACAAGSDSNNLFVWLTKSQTKWWPIYNEENMPEFLWNSKIYEDRNIGVDLSCMLCIAIT